MLSTRERRSTAALIAALAEVYTRRLYLAQGYSSLFEYCRLALHLSEDAAYNRMRAAHIAAQWPIVVDMLGDGSLNLTTVRLLSGVLTDDNYADVLRQAMHKTKREVEAIVARLAPRAASPSYIHQIGPDHYSIEMTIDRETHDRLRELQDLLRHQIPSGDPAAIISLALKVLLQDVRKRRLASTSRPRRVGLRPSVSRHVPAAVRRAVYERDRGRCAYIGASGRCTERGFLEIHHVVPFARGGQTTVDNLQLRCRAHNAYEAEEQFGPHVLRERPIEYGAPSALM